LKLELARVFPNDRPSYLESKAPFIRQVLRLAIPEAPPLWTAFHDSETGLSFNFSQEIAGLPVTMEISHEGDTRRIHLLTDDRRTLYFEIRVYDEAMDVLEAHRGLLSGLREQYPTLDVTELRPTSLSSQPARQFKFAADSIRRVVVFVQMDTRLARIIFDPFGPLNWAILDTLALPQG
jgi:hypothetical protein